MAWKQLPSLCMLCTIFNIKENLFAELYRVKVLKLHQILNFISMIDTVGGVNWCFVYTGSWCYMCLSTWSLRTIHHSMRQLIFDTIKLQCDLIFFYSNNKLCRVLKRDIQTLNKQAVIYKLSHLIVSSAYIVKIFNNWVK